MSSILIGTERDQPLLCNGYLGRLQLDTAVVVPFSCSSQFGSAIGHAEIHHLLNGTASIVAIWQQLSDNEKGIEMKKWCVWKLAKK
jgi:hypothetical protein